MTRKIILVVVIALLLAIAGGTVYAAPPPGGPPGLERAIAVQEAHNPNLLRIQGVVGTAVGLTTDGQPAVKIFTETARTGGFPASLDSVPVVVQVTGKLFAVAKPPSPPGKSRNNPPQVSITSPANGATYESGATITFSGTATDKEDGNISSALSWKSSIVAGVIGSGASFSRTLPDGTHTITASVTDSGGKSGSASITISVAAAGGGLKTTDKWPRPVPVGISTGNANDVSAGTIACRLKSADGSKLYALSNTHVYAPRNIENLGALGNNVSQPGVYDIPGRTYADQYFLGKLTAYKPIDGGFFATNYIDAAIAETTLLDKTTPLALGGYGIPNSTTIPEALNMAVQKFGRTTQLTRGKITGVNATIMVEYYSGWYAFLSEQIIIESTTAFIGPGDSGSLLVTDDVSCNPVGLLFAGNSDGKTAIANRISRVLEEFGVSIDGK